MLKSKLINFIEFKSIRTKDLTNNLVKSICILKDSHWKFGISSQKKWFKDNNKKNDLHNLLFHNKKLIGYTCLRKKKMYFGELSKYYLLFDTLIINKKYRKLKLSEILMKHNNNEIKKSNYCSFLLCDKKLFKFYQKCSWKEISNKIETNTKNVESKGKKVLSYNCNNINFKKTNLRLKIY